MFTRRRFLSRSILGTAGIAFGAAPPIACKARTDQNKDRKEASIPLIVSTWDNRKANTAAWEVIGAGGRALDAVERGVRVPEADPEDMSVGYGGRPDREGIVTLDACIMDEQGNCGSVCFLQHIKHPISVARKVMEDTPHVMLAGEGALQFAISKGFKKEDLLTEGARLEWEEWKKEAKYEPVINVERHDTIGMLAIDQHGRISGACTTSGLAYKMHGRVGDSPIIGAGLYVDDEVGGAVATGMGEAVIRSVGSFLVVELMRQGKSPQEACEEAVNRIAGKQDFEGIQVGYLAVNKSGEVGSYSIQAGFEYALTRSKNHQLIQSKSLINK